MPKANGDPTLFDASMQVPDGFIYRQNFVSEAEEQELIREIQKIQLEPFKYYQFTGKRRTASFGWQYEFGASEITAAPEMPPFLLPLRTRAGKVFNIDPISLIQTSIIEYSTGSPIGWHRDIPYFGIVVGVSLGAACRMRFRKYSRVRSKKLNRDEVLSIELQPRSVYLMSGASREIWQHSIPPVKELRYAIMMRTLRAKPEKNSRQKT
ncbi:MAG TPA: alpha-ketoglutarate-dependent dioxygenase AlkB [Candidatus Nitrosocosmicus sp.]|nr:alpha-ketoglutarate-dependent dioxygenase AlkB [Candidatus Nitrosocosmicus sp.]